MMNSCNMGITGSMVPTVCYTVYLIDPSNKNKCHHVFPKDWTFYQDWMYGPEPPCVAYHLPSIDLLLIASAEPPSAGVIPSAAPGGASLAVGAIPSDDSVPDIPRWMNQHFDLDICANVVFNSKCRSMVPTHIFNFQAQMKLDHYCCNALIDDQGNVRTRSCSWKRSIRDSKPNDSDQFKKYCRVGCRCEDIITSRIEKYQDRGFNILVTRPISDSKIKN